MKKSAMVFVSSIFALLLIVGSIFQNCSSQRTPQTSVTELQKSTVSVESPQSLMGGGNGDGYDGKLTFAHFGESCEQNQSSNSGWSPTPRNLIEVEPNNKTGLQVRKDCLPLDPPQPVNLASLLPHNLNLALPSNEIYDKIASSNERIKPEDISELVCRVDRTRTNVRWCEIGQGQDCPTYDSQMIVDLQLSRRFNSIDSASSRMMKVSLGLYKVIDGKPSEKPYVALNSPPKLIVDKVVSTFEPLTLLDPVILKSRPLELTKKGTKIKVRVLGSYAIEWKDNRGHLNRTKFVLVTPIEPVPGYEVNKIYISAGSIELDSKIYLNFATEDLVGCITQ